MICVLKIKNGDVTGWMQGKDCIEVAREAGAIGRLELQAELLSLEHLRPGKYQLECGHTLLAS